MITSELKSPVTLSLLVFFLVTLLPEFSYDVPYGHILITASSYAISPGMSLEEWAGMPLIKYICVDTK